MKIISIEKNKKNKDKITLYIDDKYYLSIPEEEYIRLNLYEREEITPEEFDYIKNQVNFRYAKSAAIKNLSLKYRCEKEVYDNLKNQGFEESDVIKTIDELKSMGYINDMIYAQKYIHDRTKLKPKSKRMLKFELKNKGVPEHIIDEAVDAMDIDEAIVAEGLVRKKFGKYDFNDEKVIKKVYYFLRHRGYNFEIIDGVIKKFNSNK
ncbi:MAG: regulatory protein RecX [Bacillota bacterium]|nr:regulatory protein RecX [Bacillota bacterium]